MKFQAMIRSSGLAGFSNAGLFARVHRPSFGSGQCSELNEKPDLANKWVSQSVIVDVAIDAEQIEVGFVLHMAGTAWFDNAHLEILGPANIGNEPPAVLTGRGLVNLEAFTRLSAYLRFFHPSDESAALDWDRFVVGQILFIETALTPKELAERLETLYRPIAPTLQVYATGTAAPLVQGLAPPTGGSGFRTIAWRHIGAAPNGPHSHYRHFRVADRDLEGGSPIPISPDPLRRPSELFEVDLGGGVSCRFPLTLYADAKGTLPRASARLRPSSKPQDFPPSGEDRATRLACVCLSWGVLQHFYPYFEETQANWPAALREALQSGSSDRDATEFHLTLRKLVAQLKDSHGAVRPGSGAIRNNGALPFSWDIVEDKLAVTWVEPRSDCPVKVGDVVESIDGIATAKKVQDAQRLASGATPEHRRYRTCADLRVGPAGKPVSLEARSPQGDLRKLIVSFQPADESPLRGPSMREPKLERFARLAPGVVYIDLDRYRDQDFEKVMADAKKEDGVVFDLRGYPQVGTYWLRLLAKKPLVQDQYSLVITQLPDRMGIALDSYKSPILSPLPGWSKTKVAFVTDGRAVSYAETFLAIVDNMKLAPIVGEPTAGSNGVIALYVLPDGSRISWTGQKAIRADGSQLHGIGIKPTISVRRTLKGLAEGRDEALEKAIELVTPRG
ncbi:MAG: S41 family peptidase [Gemmatales bacterium]